MAVRLLRKASLLAGLSAAALATTQAQAQVVTDIAPDVAPGFDTGTVVNTVGSESQITGGELSGGNLFHSFAEFDLANGDTATWVRGMADAGTITNVINRVRSGTASDIHGTLAVADMPNADFWFINPAGVVFGDGASVQVPNAAYFSTAHEIGFGSGQRFSTVTPDGSTFSSAPPAAFGFLGGQGNISLLGDVSTAGGAAEVTLVANNIGVDAFLEGDGTQFTFAAVGGDAEGLSLADITEPTGDGFIQFAPSATLFVDGASFIAEELRIDGVQMFSNGAGDFLFRGDDVFLVNGALVRSDTVSGAEGDVRIDADFLLITNGSAIRTFTDPGTAIEGGSITVEADTAVIDAGANVRARSDGAGRAGDITFSTNFFDLAGEEISSINFGSGDSGNIEVSAQEFFMPGGFIFSEVYGDGQGGDVSIEASLLQFVGGAIGVATYGAQDSGEVSMNAQTLVMAGNAFLTAQAFNPLGARPGTISINAEEAQFFGGQATSVGFDGADAGDVEVNIAGSLSLFDRGRIRSLVFGDGNSGNVSVRAGSTFMTDGTEIISVALGDGTSGNVALEVAGPLQMEGFAQVRSRTEGVGDTGDVFVQADDILMVQAAFIETSSAGDGNAGNVQVVGDDLTMFDEAKIRSVQDGSGTAGDVAVQLSGNLVASGFTEIQSSTNGLGDAGDVTVVAANARLSDSAYIRSNPFGAGAGGRVEVNIGGLLYLTERGRIETATGSGSTGAGGQVVVTATDLLMEGGEINSSSFGSGPGGLVSITVDNAVVDGGLILSAAFEEGDAGTVVLDVADLLRVDNFGRIEAFTLSSGNAGDIFVRAGDIFMNTGIINSDTLGSGNSGSVTVEAAGNITLQDQSTIQALADPVSSGNAGSIRVVAGDTLAIIDQFSGISAEARSSGDAGSIYVEASDILLGPDPDALFAGGRITSLTVGDGNAGDVTVVADNLVLRETSRIEATAFFDATGDAGQVRVDVSGLIDLGEFTRIESNNFGTGGGGDVEVSGGTILLADQARIRAPSTSTGDSGNVRVAAGSLVLEGGGINTSAIGGGKAGSVSVDAGHIAISNGANSDGEIASITFASGDAGTVLVNADSLTMDGGQISSSTFDEGNAGSVFVQSGTIAMRADATISSAAVIEGTAAPTGDAGSVTVSAYESILMLEDSGILAATDGPGVAGSVSVETPALLMDGGKIDSSTSSSGNAGRVRVDVVDAVLSGDARVTSNALSGSTGDAGNIIFDASGSLELHDDAGIVAGTRGSGMAGLVDINTPSLFMDGGAIASSTESSGNAGDVLITAGSAFIVGDAKVNSGALQGSSGEAGIVDIVARDLLVVAGDAVVSASTAGTGDAGAVFVATDRLEMFGGEISSFTRGAGDAGIVVIGAQEAFLSDQAFINSIAFDDSTGDAGGVLLQVTGPLALVEGSSITASTQGIGVAGEVVVDAGELFISGGAISSSTSGLGDAGDVTVRAGNLSLGNGTINSSAVPLSIPDLNSPPQTAVTGNAGNVVVTVADVLDILPNGSISAASETTGFAGTVEVNARVLNMNQGAINSFTAGPGDAGLVGVFVDELNMVGGRIDSASDSSAPDAGDAGSVFIAVRNASLSGFATIDSRALAGNAGDVTLEAFERLEISDMAEISAATLGAGDAGLVQVAADELVMTGGAINSFTGGSGDAGLVSILARQLTMSGGMIDSSSESLGADAGNAGGVEIIGNGIALSGLATIESVGVVGNAGDIRLEILGPVTLADDARISASGEIAGDAGSVFLMADSLTMNGGEINSLTNGSGTAGIVFVDVGELVMNGGRITSASQGPLPIANLIASSDPQAIDPPIAGDAGDVFLRANNAVVDFGASIDSASVNSNAGNVTVAIAGGLQLLNGGQISTAALGGGDAGAIEIATGGLLLDNFGQITSTAEGEFAAGTITIAAEDIEIRNGSEISTNSAGGPAGNIALFLPQDGFLRLAGQEFPGVITTSSGANTGGQIIISDPFLILSEGGSILALGQQGGANVQIQSAFFIRSSDALNLVSVDGSLLIESNVGEQITGTEVADIPFLDASGILSGQCSGVRQSGEVSQFSSRITGPYAPPSDEVEQAEDDPLEDLPPVAALDEGVLAPCG